MNQETQAPNPFALQQKPQQREVEYVPFGGGDKIKLSVAIIQSLIAVPTKSGKICSERDAMKFLMLCRSRGLNPFEGDAFLIGYDGQDGPTYSLITAHQAFLKRAELNPEYDGMESGVIIAPALACPMCSSNGGREVSGIWVVCSACKGIGQTDEIEGDIVPNDHQLVGGWARVHFKNRKIPMKRRVATRTFNKGFGRWKDDAAGMIVKCAEADALRSSFPTKLGGLFLREEQEIPMNTAVRATDLGTIESIVTMPAIEAPKQTRTRKPKDEPAPVAATQAANSDPGDDVPMDYPDKPAEAPKGGGAPGGRPDFLASLKSMITASGFSEATFIEVCVRRFKGPTVKTVDEFPPDYVTVAVRDFDLIQNQMKMDRATA